MIVVSNPTIVKNEIKLIHSFFDEGLLSFHIRKPLFSEDEMKTYLHEIGREYADRLVLHSHHHLAKEYEIHRLHFTEKRRAETPEEILKKWKEQKFTLSTSVHNMTDFERLSSVFAYAFLGPVFESISKPNYASHLNFKIEVAKRKNNTISLIALGGITPQKTRIALQYGFDDVAYLGTIWNSNNPKNKFKLCQQIAHLH